MSYSQPSATFAFFVDGALVNSYSFSGTIQNFSGWWRVGSYELSGWGASGGSGYFPGNVDEVHVASTVRSANWIATEYNNQKSPSAFFTDGPPSGDLPPTSVALASSQNPSLYNGAVTFTATVTGTAATPTGTVTFYTNGISIGTGTLTGSGVANFSISNLPVALTNLPLSITAAYSGDNNNSGSLSEAVSQLVSGPSSITVQNPSFESPVEPTSPIGQYSTDVITDWSQSGTQQYGVQNDANTSTYTSGTVPNGVQVAYVNGGGEIYQVLATALSANTEYVYTGYLGNNLGYGTLTAGSQDGTIGLSVGNSGNSTFTEIASKALTAPTPGTFAQWYVTYTSPGSIPSADAGDLEVFLGGYGNQVNYDEIALACGIPTTTAITTSQSLIDTGASVTFTATVSVPSGTSSPTTGTVVFYDNGTNTLGTVALNSSSQAALSTSALSTGNHGITAAYSGNGNGGSDNYAGSISSALTQAVGTAIVSLSSSQNPSLEGGAVTFTATLSWAGSATPTGTVTFYTNGTIMGIGNVNSSGVANISTASLPETLVSLPWSVTGVYSGDGNYIGITSPTLFQAVTAPSSITVPNGSFEANVLAFGANIAGATDWTLNAGSGTSWGTFCPTSVSYPGITASGLPAPASGVNVGYLQDPNGSSIFDGLTATLAANTTYVLSGALGVRLDVGAATSPQVVLTGGAGAAYLNYETPPIPAAGHV